MAETLTRDQIAAELDRLASARGGRLLVDDVVEAARPELSLLHAHFDWDVKRCAERDLRQQARDLIARIRYVSGRHERIVVRSPLYVRDPDAVPSEQGYTSVTEARKDPKQARRTLDIEFDRAKSAMRRACAVAEVLGLADDVSSLLHQLEAIAAKAQVVPREDETDPDQPVA